MSHPVPDTSKSAFKEAKKGLISGHKSKILAAFERLGSSTADEISAYLGLDHVQINRRFVELAEDEKIYNTQLKRPTRRGRDAFVWSLVAGIKTDNETKNLYTAGQKASSDYSKELIQECGKQLNLGL